MSTEPPNDDPLVPEEQDRPEFDGLFLVGDGEDDAYRWFTPRLAARVWLALDLIADEYHVDPEAYEDRLPPIARNRGPQFAARISQAAGELRDDIACGEPPLPRSTGESIVLGWALPGARETARGDDETTIDIATTLLAELALTDEDSADPVADLFRLYDLLFQDLDFETLYDPELDGVDATERGRQLGMESLSPADWFVPYDNLEHLRHRPEPALPGASLGDMFTLEVKVSFQISDPDAVQAAAVAYLSGPKVHFTSKEARQEEITRVKLSVTEALLTLADTSGVLDSIPGAQEHGTVAGIEAGDSTS